jgi:hypothetical protein
MNTTVLNFALVHLVASARGGTTRLYAGRIANITMAQRMASCCVGLKIHSWMVAIIMVKKKEKQFAELVIHVKAAPLVLFRVVKKPADGKRGFAQDVDMSTVYEHGWIDSDHFRWFVPDGRYWVIQGEPGEHHICSVTATGGTCVYKEMTEFDLKKWRDAQKEEVSDIMHMRKPNSA